MTAVVELVFDSIGGSAVAVECSLGDQYREVDLVRPKFGVSTLIEVGGGRDRGEGCVNNKVSRAVNCVGSGNVKGVAISGNPKYDLFRREASISPSLDGLDRGALLNG